MVVDPHGEYVPLKDSIHRLGHYDVVVVKVSHHHAGDLMYRIGVLDSDPEALASAAGVPPGAKKIRYALYLAWHIAKIVKKSTGVRGAFFYAESFNDCPEGETPL